MSMILDDIDKATPAPDLPDQGARLTKDEIFKSLRETMDLAKGARVVVAMSGGVDSTVTAALLKQAGYDVIGITLQLYDHGAAVQKKGACCAGQDIKDARMASQALGIPHYVIDKEERFQKAVIADFTDSYLRGETPVPCIRCNQTVKFHDLLDMAKDFGAKAMATGHYVQRMTTPHGPSLHRARDPDKDQSYFLFATKQEQLKFLRFPLGAFPKSLVRQMASDMGLVVAQKPDSQDICFVPQGHYKTLIDRLKPKADQAGDIIHMDGRILGRHEGISRYTVGQRRGLNIAVGDPLFVTAIDVVNHRIIVGPREALQTLSLTVKDVNWLRADLGFETAVKDGLPVLAKVRSTRPAKPARLGLSKENSGSARVIFDEPEDSISPGQACVLYDPQDPSRLLGGGFITRHDA